MDVIKDGELHFWVGALLFLFIVFDQTLCLLVTPSLNIFNVPGNDSVHGAFLGTFRFVGLYKKVLYTTV